MFTHLRYRLERAFKTLKGNTRITEINVATTVKEIRKALIEADVEYKVAQEITKNVKAKAMGMNVLTSVSPGQLITKITQDELTTLMGTKNADITLQGNPAVILMAGLQGSGKTTFSGKLAHHLKKQGRSVLLAACDVHRPAAVEQLQIIGQQINIDVFSDIHTKDAVKIAKKAVAHARQNHHQILIVDTAGRQAVNQELMDEIVELKTELSPSEILFVVDAMTGQDAVNTAKTFYEHLHFDGVVLTKTDGDTRGGAALSVFHVVHKPIKFISTGERMDELERFHPDRMASRILGMGDVVSLVEKAQQTFDEQESRKLQTKLRKNTFDYNDFVNQINQVKKMGSLSQIMGMIPGIGNKAIANQEIDDQYFSSLEAMVSSMTPYERSHPDVINVGRKNRLAKGSGLDIQQINKWVKQFEKTRKLMKKVTQKGNLNKAIQDML